MHHRHVARRGDNSRLSKGKHIIPKEYVDAIGVEMDRARKINRGYVPKVQEEALEHCKNSYHAASGDDDRSGNSHFDDNGLFVCQCRHGIPIFIVNVDTPGEQQKYVIAVLRHLFSMLPPHATVILFYDIACIIESSVLKVIVLCTMLLVSLSKVCSIHF
jgi:hypothetical protein